MSAYNRDSDYFRRIDAAQATEDLQGEADEELLDTYMSAGDLEKYAEELTDAATSWAGAQLLRQSLVGILAKVVRQVEIDGVRIRASQREVEMHERREIEARVRALKGSIERLMEV